MALIRNLGALGLLTAVGGFIACARMTTDGAPAPGEPNSSPPAPGESVPVAIVDHPRLVDTHQARLFSDEIKADRAMQDALARLRPQTAPNPNWTVPTGSPVVGAAAVFGPSFTNQGSTDQMFFGVTGSGAGKGITPATSITGCSPTTLCTDANFFALTTIYTSPSLSWSKVMTKGTSADVALNGSGTEVYVLDDGGTLHCFMATDGSNCTTGGASPIVWASPTITITGVAITPWVDTRINAVYVNDGTKHLYKFNATTGAQDWVDTYTTGAASRSWPVEVQNVIYIGDGAGKLYRITDSGTSSTAGTYTNPANGISMTGGACDAAASIDGSISLDISAGLVFLPNTDCLYTLNHYTGTGTFAIQHEAITYSRPASTLETWPALDGTYAYWVIPLVPTYATPISAVWKAPYNLSSVTGSDLVNATSTTGGATRTAAPLIYSGAVYVGDTTGQVERFGCASSNFSTTSFAGYTSVTGNQINTPIVIDNMNGNIEYGYSTSTGGGGVAQFPMNMGTASAFTWNCPTGQTACDNQQCGAGTSKTACVPTAECAAAGSSCVTVASVNGSSIHCAAGAEDEAAPANSTISGNQNGTNICPTNKVIVGILAASYGSNGGAAFETCPSPDAGTGFDFSGTCFESASLSVTDNDCPLGHQDCNSTFLANNAVFGNPCPDVNKFFAGWFVCASSAPSTPYVFCSRQNVVAWQSDGGLPTGETANDPCDTSTGKCTGTCLSGWGDCNANLQYDGCETRTGGSDTANCGGCGSACPTDGTPCSWVCATGSSVNVTASSCTAGVCTETCSTGFTNCDGFGSNGCETNTGTSTTSCGSCTTNCNTNVQNVSGGISCASSACTYSGSCNAGFADCDGNKANGCEANITNSVTDCGSTCTDCTATVANVASGIECLSSACTYTGLCDTGFGDCDGNAANGCETNTTSNNSNCGGCGAAFACSAGFACVNSVCTESQTFTTSGTFTVPSGVTSISYVVVGAGGGGSTNGGDTSGAGGGALCYRNNITVTPLATMTVTVGTGGTTGNTGNAGGSSVFNGTTAGGGGGGKNGRNATGGAAGTFTAGGATCELGGVGGADVASAGSNQNYHAGAGGAAGYAGAGGAGAAASNNSCTNAPAFSGGGGGGGGSGSSKTDTNSSRDAEGGSGGGVGLLGTGTSGAVGITYCSTGNTAGTGGPGGGGSAGSAGSGSAQNALGTATGGTPGAGGLYGGGGGYSSAGGGGAVRIIWGSGSYP